MRVPLRLDQALLREPAEYRGTGEHFMNFEGDGEGYVSWIRGDKESLHEIALKDARAFDPSGDEKKLKLSTPRAAASEMKLKIPEPGVVGTVSEGATLLPAAPPKQTVRLLLSALGLGGEFQLAWHKAGEKTSEVPPVLEAIGKILARLDNQGVTSEADISVHGHGTPFDRFACDYRRTPSLYRPIRRTIRSCRWKERTIQKTINRWSKSGCTKRRPGRSRFVYRRGGTLARNGRPTASIWAASRLSEQCVNGE